MTNQGQTERVLGLAAGEALGGIDHSAKLVALRKLAVLGGDSAGYSVELRVVGQFVLDDGEELLEFSWNLRDGSEHHEKRPRVLALRDLPFDGLNDLNAGQEPVKVSEHEQRRRGALRELAGGADDGERVRRVLRNGCRCVSHGQSQPGVAVPGRQPQVFSAGEGRDLADGLVGLMRLDPQAGEAGGDELGEAGGERGWGGGGHGGDGRIVPHRFGHGISA